MPQQTQKKIKALEQQLEELIVQADKILTQLNPKLGISPSLERELDVLNKEIWDIQMQIMHCDQPLMYTRSIGDCFKLDSK